MTEHSLMDRYKDQLFIDQEIFAAQTGPQVLCMLGDVVLLNQKTDRSPSLDAPEDRDTKLCDGSLSPRGKHRAEESTPTTPELNTH
ncbi:hypothetical protein PFLUV_G00064920 [Perca fluviatilis]|uniref:Uncharacterized protein n=1 Tax=Perca fluviatilis TaxID=8168 RepID=A0A6A5EH53_PERFL|nr:hypothetical protein PFLUV_G00064920 [Perca fluviatilis]